MGFSKRCRTRTTPTAIIRSWAARDAPILVEEIRSRLGLPTRYLVIRKLPNSNQTIVSRHRLRSAAFTAAARLR